MIYINIEIDLDHKYKFLVIYDDCVTDNDSYSYKKVEEYFSFGRKKGITLAFLSQSFLIQIHLLENK